MQLVTTSAFNLRSALSTHAVELVFTRRIRPAAKEKWGVIAAPTRRMFATNCMPLLTDPKGMRILQFAQAQPTKTMFEGGLRYNPIQKGLVCAFDLFWLEYRMISAESCGIVTMLESDFAKQVLNEVYGETDLDEDVENSGMELNPANVTTSKFLSDKHYTDVKSLILAKIKREQFEKNKKTRAKLQLPMSLKTEEERKLFWTYWYYNIQPKSVQWKLQFENK